MPTTTGNILTMQMLTVGKKFCIMHSTLIGWSQTLKEDLAERSIVPMEKFTDIASGMKNVQEEMASLTSEIRETKVEGIQNRNEGPENSKEHRQGGDESSSVDTAESEKKRMQNANDVLKDRQMRAA
eukprot:14638081-Ditylum_brightwellii.AAC.1